MSTDGQIRYWWLACAHGCTVWVESETTTPPMPLTDVTCRYDGTPMRPFLPLDVKG